MAAPATRRRRASCTTIDYNGTTTRVRRVADLPADPRAPADAEHRSVFRRVSNSTIDTLADQRPARASTACGCCARARTTRCSTCCSATTSAPSTRRRSASRRGCRSWAPPRTAARPRRAPGEQVEFTKFSVQVSRNADAVPAVDDASVALQGTRDRPGDRRHPAAGGEILSRRPALQPRLLFRSGHRRQRARRLRRTAAQHADPACPSDIGLDVAAQFYAFYDWGETWENQQDRRQHASCARPAAACGFT